MRYRFAGLFVVNSLGFVFLSGCGNGAKEQQDKVVTTTGMVAALARRVGGNLDLRAARRQLQD